MSKACQLFSGSSGNSILITYKDTNILIDIGVSAKRCEQAIRDMGVEPENINAVFITHEHRDHSQGVRVFASRYNTPVFANPISLDEMLTTGLVNNRVDYHRMNTTVDLNGIYVSPFKLSHDSVYCVGYRLEMPDRRVISVCTDTGFVTDEAKAAVSGSDLVFLESNHEVSMVQNGPYTYPLKQRILSDQGHLSNFTAGEFAKDLLQSGTSRIVLSHLSRENNSPHLAYQTTVCALDEIGAKIEDDYRLYVSPPENDGGFVIL